jgi:hypothetical protein
MTSWTRRGRRRSGDPARRQDRRRLEKTSVPRVYRRLDADGETVDYVAVIDVAGRQRKKIARTFTAAKRLKRHGDIHGDWPAEPASIRFLRFLDDGSIATADRGVGDSATTPARNTGA